jgi:hypothetical protein
VDDGTTARDEAAEERGWTTEAVPAQRGDRTQADGRTPTGGPEEADGTQAGGQVAAAPSGRFPRLRRHWLLASAVALGLVAAGTAVPLVLLDDESCTQVPAATRALARHPAEATRSLDPGDDMTRFDAVRALVAIEKPCGDGGRVLGQVVDAATRASAPGRPHTLAQARATYAVVASFEEAEVPSGMAPGLARMLADYVVDANRYVMSSDEAGAPAASADLATPDPSGWTRYGRFLAPQEAHADFEYESILSPRITPVRLFVELAHDPEAFAVLYDAQRAYLAHYLERLTRQGGDPGFRPQKDQESPHSSVTTWPDNDLEDIARRCGTLLGTRTLDAREGRTGDLAAFDATVRRHTRGVYRSADRMLTSRPPMGDIASRPVNGPVRGDLMDGRHQLFTVLDDWARARAVPAARVGAMRQIIDDGYVGGFRYGF